MTDAELAKYIDHTILKQDAKPADIEKLCAEAVRMKFASVCVNGCHLPLAAKLLAASGVLPCVVIGFPLGAMSSKAKALETGSVVADGAREVDMVISVGHLKAGDRAYVKNDIAAVVAAAGNGAKVKVIIETCLLTDPEKVIACNLACDAGAAFVKTSTGFSTGGATAADVKLMRQTVGADMGVKASGGIKTREDALAMINAGASRLGTSSGMAICSGA